MLSFFQKTFCYLSSGGKNSKTRNPALLSQLTSFRPPNIKIAISGRRTLPNLLQTFRPALYIPNSLFNFTQQGGRFRYETLTNILYYTQKHQKVQKILFAAQNLHYLG